MKRHYLTSIVAMFAILILTSCGGVAQNPTAPSFQAPGGQAEGPNLPGEGTPGDLVGQLSGGGAEMGEELLHGTFEDLWPQGMDALETGQIVSSAQFFMSAYAQDPTSADAALAYAITDMMKNHRRYAMFMHPCLDKLFMNTPLTGHPEVFPNPFITEDSYVLRLASLGNRVRKILPSEIFPLVAPVDTEVVFTLETYNNLMGHFAPGEESFMTTDPGGNVVGTPGGATTTVPGGEHTPADGAGADDGSGNGTEGDDSSRDNVERGGENMNMGWPKPTLGKQNTTSGMDGMTTDPRDYGIMEDGMGFEGPITMPGMLPEREEPISEDEWETFIREYRDAAARDGADVILSGQFYENVKRLKDDIEEHISNLEEVRTIIETEGYSLSLPFNVLDGTQKVTLMFDVDDYHMILGHLKVLHSMLSYVLAYSHDVQFILPTDMPEDADGDSILRPEEYLPTGNFGTLNDESRDMLGQQLPLFVSNLTTLADKMRPLLDAAREVQPGDPEPKEIFFLSSFHRNFVLIEEWAELIQDTGEGSGAGIAVKLASAAEITEAVVVFDALFNSPVMDIREILPSYDFATRAIVTDEENNWNSDPTFGGFFPEGMTDENTYITSGRLTAVVFSEEMGRAVDYKVFVDTASADVGDNGRAIINNAWINELVGTPYRVNNPDGEEVGTGIVRYNYILIPLFDTDTIAMFFGLPMEPEHAGMPGSPTMAGPEGELGEDGFTQTGIGGEGMSPTDGDSGDADRENGEGDDSGDEDDKESDDGDGDGGGGGNGSGSISLMG